MNTCYVLALHPTRRCQQVSRCNIIYIGVVRGMGFVADCLGLIAGSAFFWIWGWGVARRLMILPAHKTVTGAASPLDFISDTPLGFLLVLGGQHLAAFRNLGWST